MNRPHPCWPALVLLLPGIAAAQQTSPGVSSQASPVSWALLLVVVMALVLAWRRVGEWVRTRIDPTLDRLNALAASVQNRPVLRPFVPALVSDEPLPPVLGERWLSRGEVHAVLTMDPRAAVQVAADLLAEPATRVALLSDRIEPALVAEELQARGDHVMGYAADRLVLGGLALGAPRMLAAELARYGCAVVVADASTWPDALAAELRSAGVSLVVVLPADAQVPNEITTRRWHDSRLHARSHPVPGALGA